MGARSDGGGEEAAKVEAGQGAAARIGAARVGSESDPCPQSLAASHVSARRAHPTALRSCGPGSHARDCCRLTASTPVWCADTPFAQQNRKKLHPLLTPLRTIVLFLVVGVIFIPIGVSIISAADGVTDVTDG